MSYSTETPKVSAQLINANFVNKLRDGRVKEAEAEGSAFIRSKMRQESFARQILTPVTLMDDEIDRDENTDLPKKIIEIEPDSVATFVPFKGTGPRTWFKGPRYAVYFGKVESPHFTKSKFELMTYQNDIRKILSDNSVKDMSDQEDIKFKATLDDIITANPGQADTVSGGLSAEAVATGLKLTTGRRLPVGKMLMTKSLYYDALLLEATSVGDAIATRHYDEGVETEDKLWGIPVITTIKEDIIPNNEIWIFSPENYLGNFFLLQDATLFIKQEADLIEFWSYMALGIGIGNTAGVTKITV